MDDLEADPGSKQRQTRLAEDLSAKNGAADTELIALAQRLIDAIKKQKPAENPSYYQMEGNQIWLLSPGIGFDLFDLNTEKVVRKHLFNKTDFTSKDFETNVGLIDSKGRFWMGQNRYDQTSDKFTSFKSIYGYNYPSGYVGSTAEDNQGLLWNGSFPNGTFTRLNPQTGATKVITRQDGIPPGPACSYAPVTLPDGQIWMTGTGGAT